MADPTLKKPKGLTVPQIKALKPRKARYEVGDAGAYSGLVLRVTPKGARVFRWYVRSLGLVITIGPWSELEAPGHVTLKQAREWLTRLKAARKGGPAELDTAREALRKALAPVPAVVPDPAAPAVVTLADVAGEFYKTQIATRRKRPQEVLDVITKDILSVLGARPVAAITVPECRKLIVDVVNRPAPAWAFKVLGLLKQMFRFAECNDYVALGMDPAARLQASALGAVVGTRSRCLDHPKLPHRDEIRALWAALDAPPTPRLVERPDPRTGKVQIYRQRLPTVATATRAAFKILLLTGVRTCELLKARWEHLDLDAAAPTWTIPVENQKLTLKQARDAYPWIVPLAPAAVEVFRVLKQEAGASPWVMASNDADGGHYDDQSLSHALRRLQAGPAGLKLPGGALRPHDLRRTMRTHLGKLHVPRDVRERCLNHRLGRIEDTYDVGDYLDERREALEKWAAYVERLVSGAQAPVAFLKPTGTAA